MAYSFSFNSVDMSAYGLRLRTHEEPFEQTTDSIQLLDLAYGLASLRPGKTITADVVIYAADFATLRSYLDSIKSALNQREDCALAIDSITDRYWLARFVSMTKNQNTARAWEGTITFIANDPAAYANSETNNNHTIT